MTPDKSQFGKAFAQWWYEGRGFSPDEKPEALAKLAWDSAIRAAIISLQEEVYRLVKEAEYVQAALLVDCRKDLEKLFTAPSLWDVTMHYRNERLKEQEKSKPPDAPNGS